MNIDIYLKNKERAVFNFIKLNLPKYKYRCYHANGTLIRKKMLEYKTAEQEVIEEFNKLPRRLREAIKLLHRDNREKVIKAANGGFHGTRTCPIASVYNVVANVYWVWINKAERSTLKENGWSWLTYRAFIRWYEARDFRSNDHKELQCQREKQLVSFLSIERLPS